MAWATYRVMLKGDDPVDVTTNARDMAAIVMDPTQPRPLDFMLRTVHHAMLRQRLTVPRDYDGFLEALEDMPEPLDDVIDALDPTQPER